jgi:hypothetical protein
MQPGECAKTGWLDRPRIKTLVSYRSIRTVREGLPDGGREDRMKYIYEPGKRYWASTKSYWATALPTTLARVGEKGIIVDPLFRRTVRKKCFRTVRRAKRKCLESFLQEGKEEGIWRAMASKMPPAPMQSLVTTRRQPANTVQKKADLLAEISFPNPTEDEPPDLT